MYDRNCKNCKFYIKHFANYNGYYYDLLSGHCINNKLDLKESNKRIAKSAPCELWQPMEIQIAERRENIKDTLRIMAQKLDEIAQILKDDN